MYEQNGRIKNNSQSSIETFNQCVRKNFAFLKQTSRFDELWAKSIPLEDESGYLIPVCKLHLTDTELVSKLAKWRAENMFAYPSQFPVTIEGTVNWLRDKLLEVEDRLLFLVMDRHGQTIGHLGYANSMNNHCEMEIDNVIRGVKNIQPGIMTLAMKAALNWAREVIAPQQIYLRVFSDNGHAINFYHKLGFKDDVLLPLHKHTQGRKIYFCSLASDDFTKPDKYFLKMVLDPQYIFHKPELILTAGPSISARETSYVLDAVRYGWNNQWNKYLKRFEASFAEYLGVKHSIATSSCTGALHIALAALGIGPGDEVIVPDITWVATANAVLYVGAIPIFADIDSEHWCMSPFSFESLITERTKAVIPVHLYGHPAPMEQIMKIARKHNLFVVEDAAPSMGAKCNQRKTGTFGDFAAFSFQGAKVTVTGEGGMLLTNDDELYNKAYAISDQGRVPGTFWINQNGLKYKMSNIQAALGLAQIERVDELVEAKRRIFSWYAEGLSGVPHVELKHEMSWAHSIYWMSNIFLSKDAKLTRDQLRDELRKRNIDTRSVFPAISQYPIWPKPQPTQPLAQEVGEQGINLPSGVCLSRTQVDYICRSIREILT